MSNLKSKFEFSRTVANGDLYLCPCCGAEVFLDDVLVFGCSECGADFSAEAEENDIFDENADVDFVEDGEDADIFDEHARAACLEEMADVHFNHDLTEESSDEEVLAVYRVFQEEMKAVEHAMFPNGRVEDADEF